MITNNKSYRPKAIFLWAILSASTFWLPPLVPAQTPQAPIEDFTVGEENKFSQGDIDRLESVQNHYGEYVDSPNRALLESAIAWGWYRFLPSTKALNKARYKVNNLVQNYPNNPQGYLLRASVLHEYFAVYKDTDSLRATLADYEKFLGVVSNHHSSHDGSDETEAEEEHVDEAKKEVPNALLAMATCHVELGNVKTAHDLVRRLIQEHPSSNAAELARQHYLEGMEKAAAIK